MTPRRPLTLRRECERPAVRDCQSCGGTVSGRWDGPDFVCGPQGHRTEPIETGPIRTYA